MTGGNQIFKTVELTSVNGETVQRRVSALPENASTFIDDIESFFFGKEIKFPSGEKSIPLSIEFLKESTSLTVG